MKAPPLFLIALFACATHRETAASLDSKSASNEEVNAKIDTEIHKVEGPGRVTTTVEEFGVAAPGVTPDPGATDPARFSGLGPKAPTGKPVAFSGAQRAPQQPEPTLLKRTTVVEERGPITTDTHAKADSSAVGARTAILDGRVEQVKDSKPSLGIPWLMLLGGGVAAAALLTRTVWVGPLLTLCKRLLGRG